MGWRSFSFRPICWLSWRLDCCPGRALCVFRSRYLEPTRSAIPLAVAEQVGVSVAALATFATIVFVAMRAARPWQRIGVRIIGSWIAASAILVLALWLTR